MQKTELDFCYKIFTEILKKWGHASTNFSTWVGREALRSCGYKDTEVTGFKTVQILKALPFISFNARNDLHPWSLVR